LPLLPDLEARPRGSRNEAREEEVQQRPANFATPIDTRSMPTIFWQDFSASRGSVRRGGGAVNQKFGPSLG